MGDLDNLGDGVFDIPEMSFGNVGKHVIFHKFAEEKVPTSIRQSWRPAGPGEKKKIQKFHPEPELGDQEA